MKRKAPKSKGVLKPPLLVVSSEPVLQIIVSSKLFHESSIEYQHHHDYDVIIPTYISWVALVVGHIMLVTGIVAMILGFYVVARQFILQRSPIGGALDTLGQHAPSIFLPL
jgi:hypothetical protein